MLRALTLATTITLGAAAAALAQAPPELTTAIDRLGAFEYPVRMNAARAIRRLPAAQAVPALVEAARGHGDQFVRYRALVLLTAFNDRGTSDLMRSLLRDRNDRVREAAYRWFALHPDPALAPALLALLETEVAEFVRPALVSALAALGSDMQVQRALVAEAGRGLDFFRSAVIEALGQRHAVYAANTIAEFARIDGPLQDDAILALARIGDPRATTIVAEERAAPEALAALRASRCLLGEDCAGGIAALVEMATNPRGAPRTAQAALLALGAVAARPETAALDALVALGGSAPAGLRDQAAVALSAVAVRVPMPVLQWLDDADPGRVETILTMLRDGFEQLEEDLAEEQFFAAARAAYWSAPAGSPARTRLAALIDTLEF